MYKITPALGTTAMMIAGIYVAAELSSPSSSGFDFPADDTKQSPMPNALRISSSLEIDSEEINKHWEVSWHSDAVDTVLHQLRSLLVEMDDSITIEYKLNTVCCLHLLS